MIMCGSGVAGSNKRVSLSKLIGGEELSVLNGMCRLEGVVIGGGIYSASGSVI